MKLQRLKVIDASRLIDRSYFSQHQAVLSFITMQRAGVFQVANEKEEELAKMRALSVQSA